MESQLKDLPNLSSFSRLGFLSNHGCFASVGGRTLRLMQTRMEDEGQYSCVVRNAAGEERKVFRLSVLGIVIMCDTIYKIISLASILEAGLCFV